MLDKLWDDGFGGPQPEKGLKKLRQIVSSKPLSINSELGEGSGEASKLSPMPPATPGTPSTVSPTPRGKDNVWRSVFNPGSNLATKTIGADIYDKPLHPNSPTVYDWLYSGETRSTHR